MKRAAIAALLALASLSAQAADQVRNVAPFKTIDARGPVSLVVEVGKAHSVRVEGNQKFIDRVTTEVVNGELRLGFEDKNRTTSISRTASGSSSRCRNSSASAVKAPA